MTTEMKAITVVGGGLAGLVTAISAAEAGTRVRLLESHDRLGGRARSTIGPHVANDGPHVLYADGALWPWLTRRQLARPYRRLPLAAATSIRFRREGRLRAAPPAALLRLLSSRRATAPVDRDFHSWAAERYGERAADAASAFAGVATFTADPGRLSAAFVWERLLRVSNPTGGPRYLVGGWSALIDRLAEHARGLGVTIVTGSPVTTMPDGPVVVATSLAAARTMVGRPLPTPATSGSTVLLDAAVERRRGDAFIVSDLDHAGWLEAFSRVDRTLTRAAASWSRRSGRSRTASPGPPPCRHSRTWWRPARPAGAIARCGAAPARQTTARGRWTCPGTAGRTGPWSTRATGCSWPATRSQHPVCSPRSPSTARWPPPPARPATSACTTPGRPTPADLTAPATQTDASWPESERGLDTADVLDPERHIGVDVADEISHLAVPVEKRLRPDSLVVAEPDAELVQLADGVLDGVQRSLGSVREAAGKVRPQGAAVGLGNQEAPEAERELADDLAVGRGLALAHNPGTRSSNVVASSLGQLSGWVVKPGSGATAVRVTELLPERAADSAVPRVELEGVVQPPAALGDVGAEPVLAQVPLEQQ